MHPTTTILFLIGTGIFITANALPFSSDESQRGIPTSLLEIEEQQSPLDGQNVNPSVRDKRHKKKVVIINQYYGQPGYGSAHGCRGCGTGYYGGGGGYPGGNGYYPSYGYDYYPYSNGGYDYGHGGGGYKKLKKFG